MMAKTTFVATGDIFITRRLGKDAYEGFEEVAEIIRAHDVCFTNLEMTFHDAESYPAAESGGTWAMTEPGALDDIKRYGFNLFNTANNHAGDYGPGGIMATIRHLRERDMVFAGTGANLAEASRPGYLEARHARVALIAACGTLHPAEVAGIQGPSLPGRPGMNPIRCVRQYHVDPDTYQTLEGIAADLGIHSSQTVEVRMGYSNPPPEGTFLFGGLRIIKGTERKQRTVPHSGDMNRIVAEIQEAKRQADVVLVSFHSHTARMPGPSNVSAEYLETFARACIDAGADAVLGHGPHELRGIEIYREKPIFYSLGNFLFETETVSVQPTEAFLNKGMPADTKVGAYMDNRSKDGTIGYGTVPEIWKSVMASFTMEEGKLTGVTLYPVELGMGNRRTQLGLPRIESGNETLAYLASLSEPYGTHIRVENGIGRIDFA